LYLTLPIFQSPKSIALYILSIPLGMVVSTSYFVMIKAEVDI
jgi:hypothetical protein